MISKGGAIPVLVLILLVLVFLMFRISAASIIHKKQESAVS